jgi:hypothetical protein
MVCFDKPGVNFAVIVVTGCPKGYRDEERVINVGVGSLAEVGSSDVISVHR